MSKNDVRFTDSHEWVSITDRIATVGISEYAKKELGDIVAVELPKVGSEIRAGEEVCILESTKAAADVYAPLSGKVVAIHSELTRDLHPLNSDPQGRGWLFRLEVSDFKEFERLMSGAQYKKLVSGG